MNRSRTAGPSIEGIAVSCYTVPTETPESDGTYAWEKTTMVLVEATAGGTTGLGYSYADVATGKLIEASLAESGDRPERVRHSRRAGGDGARRSAMWAGPGSRRWRSRRWTMRCGI